MAKCKNASRCELVSFEYQKQDFFIDKNVTSKAKESCGIVRCYDSAKRELPLADYCISKIKNKNKKLKNKEKKSLSVHNHAAILKLLEEACQETQTVELSCELTQQTKMNEAMRSRLVSPSRINQGPSLSDVSKGGKSFHKSRLELKECKSCPKGRTLQTTIYGMCNLPVEIKFCLMNEFVKPKPDKNNLRLNPVKASLEVPAVQSI